MDGAQEAAPRYRVVSSHSGADFEAGRLCHRNGEAPNDGAKHEVVNAHEPEPVTKEASKALLDKFILLRFENFGWCKGILLRCWEMLGGGKIFMLD